MLKTYCDPKLITTLTINSVARLVLRADRHSAQDLKKSCIKFISDNTKEVMATEEWKELMRTETDFGIELLADLTTKKQN